MIFKQIHSLPTNPNWSKIALIALATFCLGVIVYKLSKSDKLKLQPPPKKEGNTN
jgi:hypothetical protein